MEHAQYRILWLTNFPFSSMNGGTERITHIAMEELVKRGHTCRYISIRNRCCLDEYEHEVQLSEFLKENRIQFTINQIGYAKDVLSTFLDAGGEDWQTEGGKILSCLHFSPKTYPYWYSLACQLCTDGLFNKIKGALSFSRVYLRQLIHGRHEGKKFCFDNSDFYITLSHGFSSELVKQVGTKSDKKIRVIPNAVSYDEEIASDALSRKKKIALVVSRLEERQKRISYILKVWRRLKDTEATDNWVLRIVGSGVNENYYKKLSRKWNLPSVEFVGFGDPSPHYKESALFLMTSFNEGWGLTISEAMHYGCVPIVMDSVPVFRDILDEHSGVLVEDGNIEAFAQSIRYLMEHDDERTKMAYHAEQRSHLFDRSHYALYWEQLFASIIPC